MRTPPPPQIAKLAGITSALLNNDLETARLLVDDWRAQGAARPDSEVAVDDPAPKSRCLSRCKAPRWLQRLCRPATCLYRATCCISGAATGGVRGMYGCTNRACDCLAWAGCVTIRIICALFITILLLAFIVAVMRVVGSVAARIIW